MTDYAGVRVVLTDIEGTTTSVAFVFEVLFPYARRQLAAFVARHEHAPAVAAELDKVRAELGDPALPTDAVVAQLQRWIDEDRKAGPLKSLQGMIWKDGYESGGFHGHVYDDALRGLRRWHAAGLRLCVYSSGSVPAQQLLFGYSEHGDLRPLFSDYFDTGVGAKRDAASYREILRRLQVEAASVLFLSDICAELDAAAAAGMQTGWLVRDAEPGQFCGHPRHASFDQINILA